MMELTSEQRRRYDRHIILDGMGRDGQRRLLDAKVLVVGAGGLGDIAIRYGYYRYETGVMLVTLVFIVAIVQLLQGLGTLTARKIDHRKQN